MTLERPVVASNHTLHTGIPAYAFKNGILKNGILTRLVASFLLFCTTSSNVLCSKFCQIWETLSIFKVAGWTHNRCTIIKKTLLLAMASELLLWDLNCRFCSVAYPWHPNKLKMLLGSVTLFHTRTMYLQTGENTKWAQTFIWCLLLIFKVVYQDHLPQLFPFA